MGRQAISCQQPLIKSESCKPSYREGINISRQHRQQPATTGNNRQQPATTGKQTIQGAISRIAEQLMGVICREERQTARIEPAARNQ